MSTILVADTISTESIYSTVCYEHVATTHGTNNFLVVSKAAVPAGPAQAPGDAAVFRISRIFPVFPVFLTGKNFPKGLPRTTLMSIKTLNSFFSDCVQGALSIFTGAMEIGMVVFFPEGTVICGLLAATAGLCSTLIDVFHSKPDPVAEELKILTQKIKELDKKVTERYKEMKLFITENKFSNDIIGEVSVLKNFLHDFLTEYTSDSLSNLAVAYEMNSPLDIAYTLMSLLSQRSTNPLIMAMEKNSSKVTFETWEKTIQTILSDLLVLESLCCGLLKNKKKYGTHRLLELVDEVTAGLKDLRSYYKIDQIGYWKEVNDWLGPWLLTENYRLTHSEKADAIKKKLESYLTSDSFYILVFNEAEWETDYYYHCVNYKDQVIGVWNQRGCNIIIYRSKKGNDMAQLEYDNSKREVKACMQEKLKKTGNLENITKTQLVDMKYVRPDGLICLVDESKDLEVRSVNCTGHQWGPGWWERVDIDSGDQHSVKTLVVGLP
ncbi:hypothetical protein CAEBREN_09107 [Caenorhabditis brenneri]|uniref:Uncharacterized protein n=1 Tax=Caenorhabditis brenneri TaxID=135651 RepID=G0NXE5_CAEBE|nr:hypothetical protein CAEBREN_09107 [Caenorhabditis brenneri]